MTTPATQKRASKAVRHLVYTVRVDPDDTGTIVNIRVSATSPDNAVGIVMGVLNCPRSVCTVTRAMDITVCVDDHALVCVDCLMYHANGDLSGYEFAGGDPAELERMIAEHLNGRHVAIGWGREQHDCATDHTVTVTRADGGVEVSDQRSGTAYFDDLDLPGLEIGDSLTIERHELRTVQETSGDCECGTYTFRSGTCDSCGQYIAGSYHAATLWGEVVNHD